MNDTNSGFLKITNGMLLTAFLCVSGLEYKGKVERLERIELRLEQIVITVDRLEHRPSAAVHQLQPSAAPAIR